MNRIFNRLRLFPQTFRGYCYISLLLLWAHLSQARKKLKPLGLHWPSDETVTMDTAMETQTMLQGYKVDQPLSVCIHQKRKFVGTIGYS